MAGTVTAVRTTWLRSASVAAALALTALAGPGDAGAVRPLLPNLVPLRAMDVSVGATSAIRERPTAGELAGCQIAEIAHDNPSPKRCLRFETRSANTGAGPLEVRARADAAATDTRVVQRVYASDGTWVDRPAGGYVIDPTHGHFHYEEFAAAYLFRSDARGRKLDKKPYREGRKAGFCLMDIYTYRPAGPARYAPPQSCYPTTVTAVEVSQVSGISPGWVDFYDVATPHQYVEITGVPDGYYLLQIVIDPHNRLLEQSEKDNSVTHHIRLCGQYVDLVGETLRCPRG